MKMDTEDADMTQLTEAEFEEKCTYIVHDHPWDSGADGGTSVQAEASLPRNLLFKYATNKEVSEPWLTAGETGWRPACLQNFSTACPKNYNNLQIQIIDHLLPWLSLSLSQCFLISSSLQTVPY